MRKNYARFARSLSPPYGRTTFKLLPILSFAALSNYTSALCALNKVVLVRSIIRLLFNSQVLGAQIEVHGVITFQDNGALTLDSAALYLTSFAQVKLYRGAQLSFEDNQGQ